MLYQYIFGYGSLICQHSRATTSPEHATKVATPVAVRGVQRVWSKRSKTLGMTAMGIRRRANTSTVGVILPVTQSELRRFDRREMGYSRMVLDLDNVGPVPFFGESYYQGTPEHKLFWDAKQGTTPKNKSTTTTLKIWAYFPNQITPPDPRHPIVQSYVDTILRGCLAVGGEEFAKEFIQQTKGWAPKELLEEEASSSQNNGVEPVVYWVNDRTDPVYIRGDPLYSIKNAPTFDGLLQTYTPEMFAKRKPSNDDGRKGCFVL